MEEEDRLTTMTGVVTIQGEGGHNNTTTRMTAMTTDRLQARLNKKIMTLLDYIVRLTDRLRSILLAFFSQDFPSNQC